MLHRSKCDGDVSVPASTVSRCGKRIVFAAAVVQMLILAARPAHSATFQVLHSFTASDGANPQAGLTLVGSTLYGTTRNGGINNDGTVFSMNLDGSNFQVVHSFSGGDGALPFVGLTLVGSTLYGTAFEGGGSNQGTIFSMNPNGSNFQTLHAFSFYSDGAQPATGLTVVGSTFYGVTANGGAHRSGTLFSMNSDGSNFQVLRSFTSTDGYSSREPLTPIGSTLYGMTVFNGGTIFSMNLNGTNVQTLHQFTSSIAGPTSGFTIVGSALYGAADSFGVPGANGTAFSIDPDGSNFRLLHTFRGTDGESPRTAPTLVGTTLYGTASVSTMLGDPDPTHDGTVYSMNPDGSNFQVVHTFTEGRDGGAIEAGLTLVGSTLYGTAYTGGAGGYGTIYSITVPEPSAYATAAVGLIALVALLLRGRAARRAALRVDATNCC